MPGSPQGFYFVSGSHDRTARVWSTDHIQPLRILAGHLSDVDVSVYNTDLKQGGEGGGGRWESGIELYFLPSSVSSLLSTLVHFCGLLPSSTAYPSIFIAFLSCSPLSSHSFLTSSPFPFVTVGGKVPSQWKLCGDRIK